MKMNKINTRTLFDLLVCKNYGGDDSKEANLIREALIKLLGNDAYPKKILIDIIDLIDEYSIETKKDGFVIGFKTAVSLLWDNH